MYEETVTGTRTKLLLYDSPTGVWFFPIKHLSPARWIMIFYEFFTQRSYVCSNINHFRCCPRETVGDWRNFCLFFYSNVTSFRTHTSDQTTALCVAAFNWCNFDCLYRSSQAATGWLIVSRLVLSVFTCPAVVLVPLIFSFVSSVPTALQRFVYARIVTCLSFLSFALVVPSIISSNFLPLFHCLYLSHFLFVDTYLVYSRPFTSLSRFTMFVIIVWFLFLNPIYVLSCPPWSLFLCCHTSNPFTIIFMETLFRILLISSIFCVLLSVIFLSMCYFLSILIFLFNINHSMHCTCNNIQGVPEGMCQTSGGCSLC